MCERLRAIAPRAHVARESLHKPLKSFWWIVKRIRFRNTCKAFFFLHCAVLWRSKFTRGWNSTWWCGLLRRKASFESTTLVDIEQHTTGACGLKLREVSLEPTFQRYVTWARNALFGATCCTIDWRTQTLLSPNGALVFGFNIFSNLLRLRSQFRLATAPFYFKNQIRKKASRGFWNLYTCGSKDMTMGLTACFWRHFYDFIRVQQSNRQSRAS